MKLSPRMKGSLSRKILAFFYSIFRRSRYFKGTSQQFFRLTLDSFLVQLNLTQDIPFLFVAVGVGLMTGYVAVMFHDAILTISTFCFTGFRSVGKAPFIDKYWIFFLPFIPAAGGAICRPLQCIYCKSMARTWSCFSDQGCCPE